MKLLISRPNFDFGDLHVAELHVADERTVRFRDENRVVTQSFAEVVLGSRLLELDGLILGTDRRPKRICPGSLGKR